MALWNAALQPLTKRNAFCVRSTMQWHGWQQAGPTWLSPSVMHSMVRNPVVTASAAPCMEEATNGCPPAVPVCQGSPSRGATRSCKRAQPLEAHRGRCQCRRSRAFPQHGARYGPVLRWLPSSQPHLTCPLLAASCMASSEGGGAGAEGSALPTAPRVGVDANTGAGG